MLKQINLALSTACGANCVFCPSQRGKNSRFKIMPLDVAKAIVDEVSSESFRSKHPVKKMEIGENGDAFLNKDIIEILRYMRSKLTGVEIGVFTNFQHFTGDKAEVILGERLVDNVACNIDGAREADYFEMKRIELGIVRKNIRDFLMVRKELESKVPLSILVLTMKDYVRAIRANFGFYPKKLGWKKPKKLSDGFKAIKREWSPMLDVEGDRISKVPFVIGWAERDAVDLSGIDYTRYSCPSLARIKEEAFIAPDGIWYACCYDADYELALGNVIAEGIDRIYSGDKRKTLVEKLEKKEFGSIGGPCRTVSCCQEIHYESAARKVLKRFFGFTKK
jgi:hypothetical protein